jgi:hypothetical protein
MLVLKIAAGLGVGYAAIAGGLYLLQDLLVFPGTARPSRPFVGTPQPRRVDLATANGVVLHGLVFERPGASDLVLGFGGNAQDAEHLAADLLARLPGQHLVVFHYRGFGRSNGAPSEQALVDDAVAIYDRMVPELAPERVFAVGVSLGSGVAAQLARARPLSGLLLITPFDSIAAIARERYRWLPVDRLLKHPFDSVGALRGRPIPVAVIAAEDDRVVRPARTAALLEGLANIVYARTIDDAGHASIHDLRDYDEAFRNAMAALASAAQGPAAGLEIETAAE